MNIQLENLIRMTAVALVAGCAHPSAVKPPSDATTSHSHSDATATATPITQPAARVGDDSLSVSDEIAKACNIHFDSARGAPKFDFDSADLSVGDREVLDQVAKCAVDGPLAGASLKLVGRADPRGEQEYNLALGGFRAGSVRTYLARLGVADSRMTLTSRGKLDASGTSEEGWRLDRRVDIDVERRGATTRGG